MTQKEEILRLASNNNGVLLTKQVTDAKISRAVLKSLVDEGKLINVQRGVYVNDEGYVDDFFLLQQIYTKGIYSHETALYLWEFSERAPIHMTMTFKQGQSTSNMKAYNIRPVMISNNFEVGVTTKMRSGGMSIRIYDIERTLVDLLKPRYDSDYEQLIPALKHYAIYEKKDINKLYRYAKIFGVEEKLRKYMEVLL